MQPPFQRSGIARIDADLSCGAVPEAAGIIFGMDERGQEMGDERCRQGGDDNREHRRESDENERPVGARTRSGLSASTGRSKATHSPPFTGPRDVFSWIRWPW